MLSFSLFCRVSTLQGILTRKRMQRLFTPTFQNHSTVSNTLILSRRMMRLALELGGCMLEILSIYLEDQFQDVRADNSNSTRMNVTNENGALQGSIQCPLLLCKFKNDYFIFADGLKILAANRFQHDIETDLIALERRSAENKMLFAIDKGVKLQLCGNNMSLSLTSFTLFSVKNIKDLGEKKLHLT